MEFRFIEFNYQRYARGANAARVAIVEDGETLRCLLLDEQARLRQNMMAFGRHPELEEGQSCFQ